MTGDGWSAAVRRRLGLGRLLALGGREDGAWITERAAVSVLGAAAAAVPGCAVTALRLAPADPGAAGEPAVPAPPSALDPGPLRVAAELAALGGRPLPELAAAVREALFTAARDRLGLVVSDVDVEVSALLDELPDPPDGGPPPGPADRPDSVAATAAYTTPGVARLTAELGPPVHTTEGHIRLELATAPLHHPLEVARAVRAEVRRDVPEAASVAVLITWVG
ncbi:hypothetical protein [Streptomyces sp. NBC_00083]|uniref:hypothetical protein n=1 Tax=Streptomyces sp. NBC_00083 TaxID=2975647 RepID=UPI0022588FA8|nr:hypothetical protein [Streptomyces sp. NBC_00083]MCX5383211.1 hypothetical protein [Streptomyces sp. NBC_00083]